MDKIELYPTPRVLAIACQPTKKALGEFLELQETVFNNFGITDGGVKHGHIRAKSVIKILQDCSKKQIQLGVMPHHVITDIRLHTEWIGYPAWAARIAEGFIRICDENRLEMMFQ